MSMERYYHPLPIPSADTKGHYPVTPYPLHLTPTMHMTPFNSQKITDMMNHIHIPKEAVEFVRHEKEEEPEELEVHNDKHIFSVYLDIRHFKPEEVDVRIYEMYNIF